MFIYALSAQVYTFTHLQDNATEHLKILKKCFDLLTLISNSIFLPHVLFLS